MYRIGLINSQLPKFVPTETKNLSFFAEHNRVSFSQRNLHYFDLLFLEKSEMHGVGEHQADTIFFEEFYRVTQLAHVCSPPSVQVTVVS